MASTVKTFAASVAERIAVDIEVNGSLQAGLNWASYGRATYACPHGVGYAVALASFHCTFPARGAYRHRQLLRQQSAISCCTMSLKIELQNMAIHPVGSDFVAWLIEMPHRRLASSEASPQSPSNRQAR
jgi:hypothetical protein